MKAVVKHLDVLNYQRLYNEHSCDIRLVFPNAKRILFQLEA